MSEEYKPMPFAMGVSMGIRQGVGPEMGTMEAINWGTPKFQLEGSFSTVGTTGRRVIREMAEANKVDLHWHSPAHMQEFELAHPVKELNEGAKQHWGVGIEAAKEIGVKLINSHVSNTLQALPPNQVMVYDNINTQAGAQHLPTYEAMLIEEAMKKKDYAKIEEIKKNFIEKLNKERQTQFMHNIVFNENLSVGHKDNFEKLKKIDDNIKEFREKGMTPEQIGVWLESNRLIESGEYRKMDPKKLDEFQKDFEKKIELERLNYESAKQLVKANRERFGPYIPEEYRGGLFPEFKGKIKNPIESGKEVIVNNFVDNYAPLVKKAIDSGIKMTLENADSRFMFSSPQEVNEVYEKVKNKLINMGVSENKVNQMFGITFDFGHANTIKGMVIDGKEIPPDVIKMAGQIKGPILDVHVHENFGDMDVHLPLGETAKTEAEKNQKIEQIMKFLKEQGIEINPTFEVGSTMGIGYAASMQSAFPNLYMSGASPLVAFGPSYIASTPVDPIHMDQKEHYFYGSWIEDIF